MSSDRSAQRGSRFVGQGEGPNREGTLFASSAVRLLHRITHTAMRDTRAGFDSAEQPRDVGSHLGGGWAELAESETVGIV
jgi:hypothetical protein